ncbi:hypothetical protein [Roseivirga sp.]|uniref:hypothetical protein n=1 Tax=Roseivirga sp. TaxID=1964215 RepID=UPI003B5261B7
MDRLRGIRLIVLLSIATSALYACDPVSSLSLENKSADTLLIRVQAHKGYLEDWCEIEVVNCIAPDQYELKVYPNTQTELPPRTMGFFPRINWVTISSSGFQDTLFYLNKRQELRSGLKMKRSKKGIGQYYITIFEPR